MSLDLACKEGIPLFDRAIHQVRKVTSVDIKRTIAHTVSLGAEHLGVFWWIVRDERFVLRILSISVENSTGDPLFDVWGELRHGVKDDCCTLAVFVPVLVI